MTVQERIARNRAMEERIAARQAAEAPAKAAKFQRKLVRTCNEFIRSIPDAGTRREVTAICFRHIGRLG